MMMSSMRLQYFSVSQRVQLLHRWSAGCALLADSCDSCIFDDSRLECYTWMLKRLEFLSASGLFGA